MNQIQYRKSDIFGSLVGRTVLAHSCNCQGVWGAGFALSVCQKYPQSFGEYRNHCLRYGNQLQGSYMLTSQNILCLFTSRGYGRQVDEPLIIEKATLQSLGHFMRTYEQVNIIMPKINSGLFKVPWHKTELILNQLLDESIAKGHTITVWEQ